MERFAIIGTAASWKMAPWNDPTIRLASLNDAYRLKGFVRADEWYDTHPLDRFYHPDPTKPIMPGDIPPGHYVRPAEHKAWLAQQQIPVWLHPDHVTQDPASAHWPSARPLPWRELEDSFGRYFSSGPALMLAHAIMRGFREIHIYGIHLSTQQEYIDQRPNFEFLIGRVLGPSKVQISVKDGLRRYETPDGMIVLPEQSPILQADWVYGLEHRPHADLQRLQWDAHRFSVKRARALQQLADRRWWQPTKHLRREMREWDAHLADVQMQIQQRQIVWRADR